MICIINRSKWSFQKDQESKIPRESWGRKKTPKVQALVPAEKGDQWKSYRAPAGKAGEGVGFQSVWLLHLHRLSPQLHWSFIDICISEWLQGKWRRINQVRRGDQGATAEVRGKGNSGAKQKLSHRSQEPQGIPSDLEKDITFPTGHVAKAPHKFYWHLQDSLTSTDITAPYRRSLSISVLVCLPSRPD